MTLLVDVAHDTLDQWAGYLGVYSGRVEQVGSNRERDDHEVGGSGGSGVIGRAGCIIETEGLHFQRGAEMRQDIDRQLVPVDSDERAGECPRTAHGVGQRLQGVKPAHGHTQLLQVVEGGHWHEPRAMGHDCNVGDMRRDALGNLVNGVISDREKQQVCLRERLVPGKDRPAILCLVPGEHTDDLVSRPC
jgi:hypothetical protein